jgi:hypothetical protein
MTRADLKPPFGRASVPKKKKKLWAGSGRESRVLADPFRSAGLRLRIDAAAELAI